jgi:hypothetical protein
MLIERVVLAAIVALPCLAQEEGAKSLFRDASSGVVLHTPGGSKPGGAPRPSPGPRTAPRPGPAAEVQPVSLPAVTGLMYWIELRTESGQLLRVNANRQFKTGERIRLHVTSNVDGELTIMQSQNNGPLEMLFPASAGQDNRVRRYEEKVFPSETGFFRFNAQTGNIRLLLMVRAEGAPETLVASRGPARPADRPASSSGPRERPQAKPGGGPYSQDEAEFLAQIARSTGSKKLEIDDSPAEAATYVVVDARKNREVTPGVLAVEVQLMQTGN